jgi:hypothetical protein
MEAGWKRRARELSTSWRPVESYFILAESRGTRESGRQCFLRQWQLSLYDRLSCAIV